MMFKVTRLALIVVLMALAVPSAARAALITFESIDLADVTAGEDLWSYRYYLSGVALGADEGFAVFFDGALYSALSAGNTPSGWDVLVFQPDPTLPSAGIYDALNLTGGLPLSFFEVSFIWHGGASGPGSQLFEFYSLDPAGAYTVLSSGVTANNAVSQVPEPSSLVFLSSGLTAIFIARRRRSSQQSPLFKSVPSVNRDERA